MIDEKTFKLFYGQKDFMLEHDTLECLEKYMMTEDLSARLSRPKASDPLIVEVEKEVTVKELLIADVPPLPKEAPKKGFRFYPRSKDSVFTCVYAAIHGEKSLLEKGINVTNLLMNEKHLISEHCNKNPNALKASNYKITIAKMNEIRCDLMTKPFMDKAAGGLVACAIYYKRPIYVVFEEIGAYLRFVSKEYVDDDESTDDDDGGKDDILLRVEAGGRIHLDQSGLATDIKANYMALPHFEKPMLGASNYKLDELVKMYRRIFGPASDKMSKSEYYEKLLVKMSACIEARMV
uniref:Uncharacterized protein n=1 Tax=viral metagenome TaxID=1070528 RepID=A0A6C0B7A3_9ZZZZ